LPSVSFLRVFRVLRLVRVVRTVRFLRELSFILSGLTGAFKAFVWAAFLLFFLLTFWSVVAVELLQPRVEQLASSGMFGQCTRCPRAFRSVMEANLTFAQSILAGDSWGQVAVPMIEAYPWSAFIFLGAMLSVNLGVMNLILSVIVDQAVEAREQDVKMQVRNKKANFQKAVRELGKICQQMDTNGDKFLSFDEIVVGYRTNEEFKSAMSIMDVNPQDLSVLYAIMDTDGKGNVSYQDFIENLYRMKTQDTHTLLTFVKFYVCQMRREVNEQLHCLKERLSIDPPAQADAHQEQLQWSWKEVENEYDNTCAYKVLIGGLDRIKGRLDNDLKSLNGELTDEVERLASIVRGVPHDNLESFLSFFDPDARIEINSLPAPLSSHTSKFVEKWHQRNGRADSREQASESVWLGSNTDNHPPIQPGDFEDSPRDVSVAACPTCLS